MASTTEAIVKAALAEEEARKQTKKREREAGTRDDDDGRGPGESSAGAGSSQQGGAGPSDPSGPAGLISASAAHKRRTAARRGGKYVTCEEDLELGNVETAEEKQRPGDAGQGGSGIGQQAGGPASEQEDGQKFTAFNLDEERATGRFDRDGNYTWNEKGARRPQRGGDGGDDDDDGEEEGAEEDAWLKDCKVLDEGKAKKLREASASGGGDAGPMTQRQIAHLNMKIADILEVSPRRLALPLPDEIDDQAAKR